MYVLVHLISVSECSPAGAVVESSGRAVGEHRKRCSLKLQSVYEWRSVLQLP